MSQRAGTASPAVLEEFLNGVPITGPVIDIHTHLPPRDIHYRLSGQSRWQIPNLGYWEQHEGFQNLTSIVRHMDCLGITKAIGFTNGFERLDEGFECVRRFPGRFLPAISFWIGVGHENEAKTTTPGGRRVPSSKAELIQALETVWKRGWRGIKIWDEGVSDPEGWFYRTLLDFADANRMLVVSHHWGRAEEVDRLAGRYPNMTFLMAHTIGSTAWAESFRPVFTKRSNVYASMTNSRHPGTIEAMVQALGSRRIVMGTDALIHTMEFSIGNIAYARIPDSDKRRILGGNMKDLLVRLGYWAVWGY